MKMKHACKMFFKWYLTYYVLTNNVFTVYLLVIGIPRQKYRLLHLVISCKKKILDIYHSHKCDNLVCMLSCHYFDQGWEKSYWRFLTRVKNCARLDFARFLTTTALRFHSLQLYRKLFTAIHNGIFHNSGIPENIFYSIF